MKKDLVIDLIQKIQKSSLCFEDAFASFRALFFFAAFSTCSSLLRE